MKRNGVNDKTGLLDAPPPQPALPDALVEPLDGPETVLEEVREPGLEPPFQPALVPMGDDELREAGHQLAVKWERLAEMTARHKVERGEMKREREELEAEIGSLARCIREQGR